MSLGLSRVNEALEALGRPDRKMDCLHVAGSNGKGSACAQLVAGLVRAGYRVGLFSSPHLVRIEERVRVDGKSVSEEEFDDALSKVKDLESLPDDILSIKGFWKNNVTRILLVVIFTNLGSSIGTFVAFPVIVKVLLGVSQ